MNTREKKLTQKTIFARGIQYIYIHTGKRRERMRLKENLGENNVTSKNLMDREAS